MDGASRRRREETDCIIFLRELSKALPGVLSEKVLENENSLSFQKVKFFNGMCAFLITFKSLFSLKYLFTRVSYQPKLLVCEKV